MSINIYGINWNYGRKCAVKTVLWQIIPDFGQHCNLKTTIIKYFKAHEAHPKKKKNPRKLQQQTSNNTERKCYASKTNKNTIPVHCYQR